MWRDIRDEAGMSEEQLREFRGLGVLRSFWFVVQLPEPPGPRVTKNGTVKGTIPGIEFKKALFSIWLGTPPVQESLKAEMLGKE